MRNASSLLPLAVAVACALTSACAPGADLKAREEIQASAPPRLETAGGDTLSARHSRDILKTLAAQAGTSEVLLHHVAVEEAYTDSPLVMGNKVVLLRDGDATYASMNEAIARARHHINVEVYTFADDEVGRELAESLVRKLRSGVEVNVIYDSVGCIGTAPEFFEYLRKSGARLVEFNPVNPTEAKDGWKLDHRDHRKLLIVDNRIAFTGGLNFATEYSNGSFNSSGGASGGSSSGSGSSGSSSGAGGGDAWRDTHVRIEGPVVGEFQKLFQETWEKQKGPALDWARYYHDVERVGHDVVRALGTTPDDDVSVIHTTLLSAIDRAEKSVYITQAYFVPDKETVEAVEAAGRRGIDVQIILPGEGFWMTRFAGRSHFRGLLEAGVKVYERNGPFLHAKTVVIDGVWSTVGSTNLDWRSLVKNDEINAVILGVDFAGDLEAMFFDDRADSRQITLHDWKRRGPATRIKEIAARVWERLL